MQKLGLVFGGGGGKGAYEIGVWEALHEMGYDNKFNIVVGTSVGALNAALFVQKDLDCAKRVWSSISNSKIMKMARFDENGDVNLFNQNGLASLMRRYLKYREVKNSSCRCYVLTTRTDSFEKSLINLGISNMPTGSLVTSCGIMGNDVLLGFFQSNFKSKDILPVCFRLSDLTETEMYDALLASSSLPFAFPPVRIHNHLYRDGGIISENNVPYNYASKNLRCDKILAIDLSVGKSEFRHIGNSECLILHPSKDLGGIFDGTIDFSSSGAVTRMKLGYSDAKNNKKLLDRLLGQEHKNNISVTQEEIHRYLL